MKEYKEVMSPVAKCLDQVQGEENAYMGNLLPKLMVLRGQLYRSAARTDLTHGKHLANALVSAFDKRFNSLLEDEMLILATAVHPHWAFVAVRTLVPQQVQHIRMKLVDELVNLTLAESRVAPTSQSQDPEPECSHSIDDEDIKEFVLAGDTETGDVALHRREEELREVFDRAVGRWERSSLAKPLNPKLFPVEFRDSWLSVFLKYNTPLPSSAAVERIFSTAGDIIRPKRSCLSASNFEELVFLKGNLQLLDSDL